MHFDGFAFVGEGRVAGNDKEAGDLGQVRGEIFRDAIAEVVLLRVFAHIVKRQDDDGGFVGQRQGLGAGGLGLGVGERTGR